MSALLKYLAHMEATVEREALDPKDFAHFGLRPMTAFPFAAAEAYADIPEVRDAYAEVSAWAFLRARYRPSKNFERKERLTVGYAKAWRNYLAALLDTHLKYWVDIGLNPTVEERMRAHHAIQHNVVAKAFAAPTYLQCQAVDRIRNAGTKRVALAKVWHKDCWTENPKAEAIVMAELGYGTTE